MALKPITRQEQIIVGKNLEPITRMERFLKEYGGGTGGSVQSDWNQNDSSAADFIKNKTHYYFENIFFNEASVQVDGGVAMFETNGVPAVGTSISLTLNGIEYVVDVFDFSGFSTFGDLSILDVGESNGLPFLGVWQMGTTCVLMLQDVMSSCTVKMVGQAAVKMPTVFYDRHTEFFTDLAWIYIDSSCTQKATAAEVIGAIKTGPVMINLYGESYNQPNEFWLYPAYEGSGITTNGLCCKVGINFNDSGPTDYVVIRTAEFEHTT